MDYPEFAYTGPTPKAGVVGFINIKETDTGILFTVRREGDGLAAAYEIPIGDAIALLDEALNNFANRE